MADAGYSGTPLTKKLGILPSIKLHIINAPEHYAAWLGHDISRQLVTVKQSPDLVHVFAKNYSSFIDGMKKLLPLAKKNSRIIIWVSWYKKSSGKATDLTENIIRDFALQEGLVDIKVCAVDENWSALKLVVPLSKR